MANSFCFPLLRLAALSITRINSRNTKPPSNTSVWSEIGEGLQVLKRSRAVRGAMIHLVLLYSLLAALYVLALQLAALINSLGPSGFGALLAMTGLGMAIGAVAIAQAGTSLQPPSPDGHRSCNDHLDPCAAEPIPRLAELHLTLCGILGVGRPWLRSPPRRPSRKTRPSTNVAASSGFRTILINIALSLPLVMAGTLVSRFGLQPVLLLLAALACLAAVIEKPWQRC